MQQRRCSRGGAAEEVQQRRCSRGEADEVAEEEGRRKRRKEDSLFKS